MSPRGSRLQMLLLVLFFFAFNSGEILADTSPTGYNFELLRVTLSTSQYNPLNSTLNCTDWNGISIGDKSYDFFCSGELGTSNALNYTMTGYITDQQAVQPLFSLNYYDLPYNLALYNSNGNISGNLDLSGKIDQVTNCYDGKMPYAVYFDYVQSTAPVNCENVTSNCDTTTISPVANAINNFELLRVTISTFSPNNDTLNCTYWNRIYIANQSYDFFCSGEIGILPTMNYTITAYITDQKAVKSLVSLDYKDLPYDLEFYNYISYISGYLHLSGEVNQVTNYQEWNGNYFVSFDYVQSTISCPNVTSSCDTTTSATSPSTPTTMFTATNATTSSTTTGLTNSTALNTTVASTTFFTEGNTALDNSTTSTSPPTTTTTAETTNRTTLTSSTMRPKTTTTSEPITCGICPTMSCPTCDFVPPDTNDTIPLEVYIYDTKPYVGTLAVAIVEALILAILLVAVVCLLFWSKCAKFRRILATYAIPDLAHPSSTLLSQDSSPPSYQSPPRRTNSIHVESGIIHHEEPPNFQNLVQASPAGQLEEHESWQEKRLLQKAPSLSFTGTIITSRCYSDKAKVFTIGTQTISQEISNNGKRKAPSPPVENTEIIEDPVNVSSHKFFSGKEDLIALKSHETSRSSYIDSTSQTDPVPHENKEVSTDFEGNNGQNYPEISTRSRGTSACNFEDFPTPMLSGDYEELDNFYEIPRQQEDLPLAPSLSPASLKKIKKKEEPPMVSTEYPAVDENIYEEPISLLKIEPPPDGDLPQAPAPPPPPKENVPAEDSLRPKEEIAEIPAEVKARNDILQALDLEGNKQLSGKFVSWTLGQKPIIRQHRALSASDIPPTVEKSLNEKKNDWLEDKDIPIGLLKKFRAEMDILVARQRKNDNYLDNIYEPPRKNEHLPHVPPPSAPSAEFNGKNGDSLPVWVRERPYVEENIYEPFFSRVKEVKPLIEAPPSLLPFLEKEDATPQLDPVFISPVFNKEDSINFEENNELNDAEVSIRNRGTTACNFDDFPTPILSGDYENIDNDYEIPWNKEGLPVAPPPPKLPPPPSPSSEKKDDPYLSVVWREYPDVYENIYEPPISRVEDVESLPEAPPPPPPSSPPPSFEEEIVEIPPEVKKRNDIIQALDLERNNQLAGKFVSWTLGQKPIVRQDKALSASDIPTTVEKSLNEKKNDWLEDKDIPIRLLKQFRAEMAKLAARQQSNEKCETMPITPMAPSIPWLEPPPISTSSPIPKPRVNFTLDMPPEEPADNFLHVEEIDYDISGLFSYFPHEDIGNVLIQYGQAEEI